MLMSLACAYINYFFGFVSVHQKQTRIGQIIDVQEFSSGGTASPDHHLVLALRLGLMKLPEKGRQYMAGAQVEIVVRPIEIGGHATYSVETVLTAIGLAHFNPGDFGNGIPLVGRLQGALQQVFFFDRLGRHFRIDT